MGLSIFPTSFAAVLNVLKNYVKFTEKHRCWSVFLIDLLIPATFVEEETPAQVHSCEFSEILTVLIGKDWCFTQFSTEMAG